MTRYSNRDISYTLDTVGVGGLESGKINLICPPPIGNKFMIKSSNLSGKASFERPPVEPVVEEVAEVIEEVVETEEVVDLSEVVNVFEKPVEDDESTKTTVKVSKKR